MKARFHDALVNMAAHPIAWPLAQLSRAIGPMQTLPMVGVVVNDFELAHDVLQRDDEFTKNGKGSIAGVMTQALGPFALSNMDGEAHRQLRSTLGNDLLSPARCDALLRECRAPIDQAERELRAGRHVDLVAMMRTLSGRLTMAMMGITPPPGTVDDAARNIYALGERIAASLQFHPMSSRRLQAVEADLRRLTDYASDAYASATLPETSLLFRLREIGLSAEEARGVISIFFIAGALTTAVALPRIVALLVDSAQMSALADGDGALARAVEEGLRYTVPILGLAILAALADASLGYPMFTVAPQGVVEYLGGPVSTAISLLTVVPSISSTVARLHDRGHSAWWLLWFLLPLVGVIVLLVQNGFLRGDGGPNKYGPPTGQPVYTYA